MAILLLLIGQQPYDNPLCGDASVSTDSLSVDAQNPAASRGPCTKVFREVASEAKTDRPRPDMVPGVVKKRRNPSSIRDAGGDPIGKSNRVPYCV